MVPLGKLSVPIKLKFLYPRTNNSSPSHISNRNECTCSPKDTYKNICNIYYSLLPKDWIHPKCPSRGEWIRKLWCVYTMAIKRTEIQKRKHCYLQRGNKYHRHDTEQKKSYYIISDTIYRKFYGDRKPTSGDLYRKGYRLRGVPVEVSVVLQMFKIHQAIHLRFVHLTVHNYTSI